jgi:diadenosine hexaphosphate hydrolase (ATP-forming)
MTVIEQAGAIVFKSSESGPSILIVKAKKDPSHWIFPKGHIDPGETAPEAGIRELAEEAGVTGSIVRPAGVEVFTAGGKEYRVAYFLVRFDLVTGRGEEGREPRFCPAEEALSLLSFPAARELLKTNLSFMVPS